MFQFVVGTDPTPIVETTTAGGMNPLWLFGLLMVFVGLGVFAVSRLVRFLRRPEMHGLSREAVAKQWAQIELLPDQGLIGAKLAVIEADKLLDGVLKSMMFPGETMADRLKVSAYKYPDIRQVWGAHKLRNQLVHDSAFELTARQAHYALKDYARALRTLNTLD